MSKRLSKVSRFVAADSPQILDHGAFVGLGLSISTAAATITVTVDGIESGDFTDAVTMEGSGKWRWANADGMNRLASAKFIKVSWSTGTMKIHQKS